MSDLQGSAKGAREHETVSVLPCSLAAPLTNADVAAANRAIEPVPNDAARRQRRSRALTSKQREATTLTDTTAAPFWTAPDYLAARNTRMYDMAIWFADAVTAGYLDAEDQQFSNMWVGSNYIADEYQRIVEWLKSDTSSNRGYRLSAWVGPVSEDCEVNGHEPPTIDMETWEQISGNDTRPYIHMRHLVELATEIQIALDDGRAFDVAGWWADWAAELDDDQDDE